MPLFPLTSKIFLLPISLLHLIIISRQLRFSTSNLETPFSLQWPMIPVSRQAYPPLRPIYKDKHFKGKWMEFSIVSVVFSCTSSWRNIKTRYWVISYMCAARVFISCPIPCFLSWIPVIIRRSLHAPLQMACFLLQIYITRNLFFISYTISRVADFERCNWIKAMFFIK